MNLPIQLNAYTGTSNPGHTTDVTCNGANSCPDYPKTDEQGRSVCCFSLPQVPNSNTALSSVIYQNGAQNLNDFQVNVGNEQSFNAANDLSVFVGPVIPASQCNVILPSDATQPDNAKFRLTWTYHSNSDDNNASPSTTPPMTDGTLPVNVLRVTSTSAFVQQVAQYNEWFICPSSQDGQVSLLQSIALLTGDNIDYFRCIYVNNQGVPLKDPMTGQLLVFSSTKNSASDNPAITNLPAVHTDCISIQFFPNTGTSINLDSILLSITIAFQTTPSTGTSSVMPQASDLQGTSQIGIDITVDVSPMNNDTVSNTAQTNAQTPLRSITDNSSNSPSTSCMPYQFDVPMSYDISIGTYTGAFDVPSQYPQQTIVQSVTVTGSSNVQDPITMLLVDSQGNTLSPSYSLNSGSNFPLEAKTSTSKIILQATALQDAAMDSTLRTEVVVCPQDSKPINPSPPVSNPSPPAFSPSPPAFNPSPPAFNPSPPAFNPSPPVFNPSPPAFNPSPPAFNPSPPAFNPSPVAFNPSPPAFNPSPPTSNPAPPASNPSPPAFNPSPPAFNPSPPAFNPSPPAFNPSPSAFNPSPPAFNLSPAAFNPSPPAFNPSPPAFNPSPLQSSQGTSSDPAVDCKERTSSTYGTYPPDLSAKTIPTKVV
jgi:hypothetical protein